MVNEDTDWRGEAAVDHYKGYEVWEYNVGPHQINEGEIDGEVDLSEE